MTKLEKALKRELVVDGQAYVVTIDPLGLKLVPKGKRKGLELTWESLLSGDEALARALNATLAQAPASRTPASPPKRTKKARAK